MKKTHLLLSLPLALGAMSVCGGVAHADLITAFNFNNGPTSGAANTATLTSTGGVQSSVITTNFDTPATTVVAFTGTITNAVNNDPSGSALGLLTGVGNVNNNRYIQFGFNTIGFQDTSFSFAAQRTSTGFMTEDLSYSLDGGSTFVPSGSFTPIINTAPGFGNSTTNVPAAIQTFNLGNSVDNQSNVIFRLTFTGGTGGNGANNRLDNFQVNANQILATPEPETWAMMALGLGALAMFTWKRRKTEGDVAYGSGFAI